MTSAEAEIAVEHPEDESNAEQGQSAPVTPWTNRQRRANPSVPGQPGAPGPNSSSLANQGPTNNNAVPGQSGVSPPPQGQAMPGGS
ncbi:hypothetical protein, partial [Nocardia anaemiae]|uniref:hypothetical protein n=1 Tax=Nocardia anaemiae TaxID=263910 RepID=UPI000AEB36C6